MSALKLRTKTRNLKNKAEKLRRAGELPAVFYGAGKTSTSIAVDAKEFSKVWKEAGESTIVSLEMPDVKIDALIHDIQLDPLKDVPIHVDFLVVDTAREVEVEVPLEFIGLAPAVKNNLGTLVKVMREVEIKALPQNLPHNLIVDISKLETSEDQILVKDIELPTGVVILAKEDEVVAMITKFKEEEEKKEITIEDIEVEKKGKKEKEAEETETAKKKPEA